MFDHWTHTHQTLLGVVFVVAMSAAILLDLWLVLVRKTKSISWRIWEACSAHPTLMVAGTIATFATCWLVRDTWPLVAFAAYTGGHLFAHD